METEATINSMELLDKFTEYSKEHTKDDEMKASITVSVDIVTAIYYFRKYRNVDEFIKKFLSTTQDYFLLQWVRSTWNKFNSMSDIELSDLAINHVSLVNSFTSEV